MNMYAHMYLSTYLLMYIYKRGGKDRKDEKVFGMIWYVMPLHRSIHIYIYESSFISGEYKTRGKMVRMRKVSTKWDKG